MEVRLWAFLGLLVLASCGRTAQHGNGEPATGAGAGAGGNSNTAGTSMGGLAATGGERAFDCPGDAPPDAPLRLLADYELENELRQLDAEPGPEARIATWSRLYSEEPTAPTSSFVGAHSELAARVARDVASNSSKLEKLTGCVIADEASCRKQIIQFVLRRLFRGLASAESEAELGATFDEGQRIGGDFQSGIRATLEVALQSPEFLYRFELGRPARDRDAPWAEPTDLEMASRLSFLFWDAGPDEALLAAAEAGKLSTREELEAQAQRLLQDPRATGPVARFYRELLGEGAPFGYDATTNPDFTPAIYEAMREERRQFVIDATFNGPGGYQALFAPHTFVSDPLAKFYGYQPVGSEEPRRLELDPTRYAGLLSMGAWLIDGSPKLTNPTRRGYAVARGLLCIDVPPEPPTSPITPPEPPSSARTTRQRFEEHTSNPSCIGCHRLMDPIGFGLEHFDALGRWRDTEDGLAIDSSGSVQLDEGEVAFDGAAELAAALLGSSATRDCFVTQWQRFAFGRREAQASRCSHSDALAAFLGSGEDVSELLVALTQTESFRYRSVQEGQP
jgi:hypothetical protein